MTTLLVTNDDGVTSPALIPLAKALDRIPRVKTVNTLVPSGERSWISKSITRFEDLEVRPRQAESEEPAIWTCSGTPADCANLGIHTVFPERPDLVVSGINIGLNHGMAFLLGSGTIGAASEGAIAGIPAVAFSLGAEGGHGELVQMADSEAGRELWCRAAEVAASIVTSLLQVGFPDGVDVLSVNLPSSVCLDTPRVFTEIARVGYDALFRHHSDDTYVFDYRGLQERKPNEGPTDREVLSAGKISISAIQFPQSVDVPESVRKALLESEFERPAE